MSEQLALERRSILTEAPKVTLRQVIDGAVERAFRAGAEWALICTGVNSPKAGCQVDKWMRAQELLSLRIIQQATREQLYKALVEAFVGERRTVTFEQEVEAMSSWSDSRRRF